MAMHKAKKELIDLLHENGHDILVNNDEYNRYYAARDSKILNNFFLNTTHAGYAMVIPEEIEDIGNYNNIKNVFKKIVSIKEWGPAFFDKKKSKQIDYDYVVLANKHTYTGSFFSFDRKIDGEYFLTKNIMNILNVIQNYNSLEKRLALMNATVLDKTKDFAANTFYQDKDSYQKVYNWLKNYGIDVKYCKGKESQRFGYELPCFIVTEHNRHHVMLVSDGTDKDLVQKYLNTVDLENYIKNNKPIVGRKRVNVSSIIIASQYSPCGYLFHDDPKFGKRRHHSDQMPQFEYYKSFQFSRLPFYLKANDRLPVNTIFSRVLDGVNPTPTMFRVTKRYNNGQAILGNEVTRIARNNM